METTPTHRRRRRRLLAAVLALLTLAGTLGMVGATAPTAGAIMNWHPGLSCNANQYAPVYHPVAPNVRKYCTGWVQSDGFAFRVEASHHYGDWGGNHDPGRWRYLIDKYTIGGQWLMRTLDITFNDNMVGVIYQVNSNQTNIDYLQAWRAVEPSFNPDCVMDDYVDYVLSSVYNANDPGLWFIYIYSGDPHNCPLSMGSGWRTAPQYQVYNVPHGTQGAQPWETEFVLSTLR